MPSFKRLLDETRPAAAVITSPIKAATIRGEPDTESDPVEISLDAQGTYTRGDAYGWQPRGDTFPAQGDNAAVAKLDNGQYVILAWWPADG